MEIRPPIRPVHSVDWIDPVASDREKGVEHDEGNMITHQKRRSGFHPDGDE